MPTKNNRPTGINALSTVPWGTHICHFYKTKEDLLDILIPYFKAGLENNELCLWLTSEPLGIELAKTSLQKEVKKLDNYLNKGQLKIINARDWYIKSGTLDPNEALQRWIEIENLVLREGFEGFRCTGNASWLEHKDWLKFAEYEKEIDKHIRRMRIIALCSYCLNKCRTSDIIDMGNNHRFTLIGRKGDWRVLESSERKRMEQTLYNNEERYRVLTDNMLDVIWTADISNPKRLNYISPSVTRLLGYSLEEVMAISIEEIFPPSSLELAMKSRKEGLSREKITDKNYPISHMLELEMKHKDGSLVPVEIRYSVIYSPSGQPMEILALARDITQRKRAQEELRRSSEKLVKALEDTIGAMVTIVEMRDPYTAGHQRRVAQLACAIAEELSISKDRISGLRLAGLIHDIGKVRVPAEILANPNGLSEYEFVMIKTHPALGYEILSKIDSPWPIAQIVHQHHERINGSGYPSGITGDNILLEARILAVADVVEAMASHRPYRPAHGINKALGEVSEKSGVLYDPQVVDACLKLFHQKRFAFE